jgi:hypothetical protein
MFQVIDLTRYTLCSKAHKTSRYSGKTLREQLYLSDKKLDLARYREGLGKRIVEVVSKFKTKRDAAFIAGISVEQLNKWCKGQVKVPVEGLYTLAESAKVDFNWLCSGKCIPDRGQDRDNVINLDFQQKSSPRIDPDTLTSVLQSLVTIMQTEGLQLSSPVKFSELVIALHDYMRNEGTDSDVSFDSMAKIIRLAAK